MNMLKRSLAVMLVLCMMLSAVPFTAFATESTDVPSEPAEAVVDAPEGENNLSEDETVADEPVVEEVPAMMNLAKSSSSGVNYRILHLDNGRKYFSADWIKALINEMAAAGYNQLQLAFGNDGLRFLLDDMTFTANGTTYSHDTVVSKVEAGNSAQNSSGDGRWLTQAEMDSIISHANSKGIEIIPLLNLPGHANAILDIADNNYNASGSDNTLDVATSDAAQAFGMAIFKKYVDYFAGKGCDFFSFGADEYANDASGSFSFSRLSATEYNKFVSFIQEMVAYIEGKGMTPRAFNDGLYYGGMNVTMDTDIECCYWSSGWNGYNLASASTISSKGHPMINTFGDFYYVLGKNECWTTGDTTTHDPNLYTAASNFDVTQFSKYTGYSWTTETISNPAGAMFCIWCDYPNFETEAQVAANTRLILRAMAAEMQGNDASSISTAVVAGGFNADGSINGATSEEPTTETVTKNEVSVTAPGLTDLTVATADAPAIEGATAALAWNVTPVTADGNYTGSAEVTLPVPADWTNVRGGVLASANGAEVMGIQGTLENGYFTFTVPHFSNVIAYNLEANITNTVNVRIPVGGTSQTYTDNTGNYEISAKIADSTVARMNISGNSETGNASYDAVNTIESGAQYLIAMGENKVTANDVDGYGNWSNASGLLMTSATTNPEAHLWTIKQVTGGYTVQSANGKYLKIAAQNNSVTLSDTPVTLSVIDNGNTFTFHNNGFCLNNFGDSSEFASSWQENNAGSKWTLKKYTPATVESTTVSFTGQKIGETYAIVGTTRYNIEVLDPANMFTKEVDVELLVDETKTFTDDTGNYEASYTGAGLNKDIAKVEVKGTTIEGETTITPVNTLRVGDTFYIQVNENEYLKPDLTTGSFAEAEEWITNYFDGAYISIKNSEGKFLTTTWDGKLGFSNSAVYPNFANGQISTYSYGIIGTAVTGSVTDPVAATDIAITGVSGGETSVVVGETRYNITVIGTTDITIKYQTANGAVIKTETAQVPDTATTYTVSSFTHTNGKFYVVDNTTLNITPATVTEYIVTVTETEEDLSQVESLILEYWQTNTQVVDGVGSTTCTREIPATEAYSKDGIAIITLVPEDTYSITSNKETDPQVNYWRSRLLERSTNEQTDVNGDDETLQGTGFTKVRYWNGNWEVYTDSSEWLPVENLEEYQFVMFFMNDMNLSDEVSVGTADWGKKGDGTMAGQYLGYDHVSIAFQVVYEDGTTAPATTSAADLDSFAYLVDNWGTRGVGTIALNQIGDYQIWKVSAETGTHTTVYNTYNPSAGDPAYITNFVWDNNEMTVWEDEENPTSHYTIVNDSHNADTEGAYANLTWDETNESILVRIYVKTVETEDSLEVVYIDEKFGDTLYTYNISVPAGNNFNDNIVNITSGQIEDPKAFAANTARLDVDGYGIVNALQKTQNFQTDLTQVPQAVGKYNSNLYTYTGSDISQDGKTLYLYYNIDTDVLSPNFVADFGLPIQFSLLDVVGTGEEKMVDSVTVNKKTKYGTLAYNDDTQIFTYTPTSILQGVDVLTINILFDGETAVSTTNVGVTPATTVFYEENFITFNSGWSGQATANNVGPQTAEQLVDADSVENSKKINEYGYDGAYAEASVGASNGTKATATALGASATFTFTGRGVQVYANCGESTGDVSVQVKNSAGKIVSLSLVDTHVGTGDGSATTGQTGNQYGLPVVSLFDFKTPAHDEYTVTITKIKDGTDPINIDGIRVINTLPNSAVFAKDLEDNPVFHELRDSVLTSLEIANNTSEDYGTLEEMAGQIYTELTTEADTPVAVVTTAVGIYGDNASVKDLLDNGPKNELFLYPQQTLTFKVNTNREVQVGLKAPRTATQATIGSTKKNITTSVDMFYTVASRTGAAAAEQTFTITNSGNDILSVTALKVCDDPGFAFAPLTQDDIKGILVDAGYTDDVPSEPETEPTEPEVPETTEPEVEETTKPSKPGNGNKPGNNKPGNNKPETTKPTKPSKPTEPVVPETTTKPTEPEVPEVTVKPTEPQKPGKPGNNGNNKPAEPQKPGKDEKTNTLKITFVNMFGKKVGTATITTTKGMVSAYEISGKAPAGYTAFWAIPVALNARGNNSIVVPVI